MTCLQCGSDNVSGERGEGWITGSCPDCRFAWIVNQTGMHYKYKRPTALTYSVPNGTLAVFGEEEIQ